MDFEPYAKMLSIFEQALWKMDPSTYYKRPHKVNDCPLVIEITFELMCIHGFEKQETQRKTMTRTRKGTQALTW